METKFKLQLGMIESLEDLQSVITNGVTREFITDMTHSTLRSYQKDMDMLHLVNEFTELEAANYNQTYTNFIDWSASQIENISNMMVFVTKLDGFLAENNKTEQGQVVAEFQTNLMNFLASLNSMVITEESLDLGESLVKPAYVRDVLQELKIVNEASLLKTLIGLKLDIEPVDVSNNKNTFIENKLTHLNKLVSACNEMFENDIEKTNDKILNMYEKFYAICYESLTDGEKAEKSRKVMKQLNPHRQLLDKLENKLTDANEFSRQLMIHKQKIIEKLENLKVDAQNRIEANPSQKDTINFELEGSTYVINNYIGRIDDATTNLDNLKEKIASHYNVLDKLEIALKSSIPTENEMKKYSSIAFKLQELGVRLDMSRSQISKEDKEVFTLIDTANSGLKTLTAYALDIKDMFIRNSLMTASYKAVNAMYEIVDGSKELAQIKVVTELLLKYTEIYNLFADEMVKYRNVANQIIRDLSIIMGRQINGVNLLEVINTLDGGIKKIDMLNDSLNISNNKQNELLNSILAF